jgi:hypothetical protein
MDDEGELLDWIHFYGFFVVLMIGLGLAGGVIYNRLSSREFEASSVVLETSGQLSARQLGPVAEAVFGSAEVYGPAMRELGYQGGPDRFLGDMVDLRPVPDTNALIVVGRADTIEEAKATADATARSLVAAFAERAQLQDFVTFGAPEAASAPEGAAVIAVVLGGAIGLWLALAVAITHYWRVRPVLRVERALRITGADLATIVDGRARWLGVLRGRPRWMRSRANRARLASIGVAGGSRSLALVSMGGGPGQVTQPAAGTGTAPPPVTGTTREREEDLEGILVAHAGSSAHFLAEISYLDPAVAAGPGARPALLWVR